MCKLLGTGEASEPAAPTVNNSMTDQDFSVRIDATFCRGLKGAFYLCGYGHHNQTTDFSGYVLAKRLSLLKIKGGQCLCVPDESLINLCTYFLDHLCLVEL